MCVPSSGPNDPVFSAEEEVTQEMEDEDSISINDPIPVPPAAVSNCSIQQEPTYLSS